RVAHLPADRAEDPSRTHQHGKRADHGADQGSRHRPSMGRGTIPGRGRWGERRTDAEGLRRARGPGTAESRPRRPPGAVPGRAAGLEPEGRPFRGHVTLARARASRGNHLPELPPPPALAPWTATEFVLYESRLGRPGVLYIPLERFALS